MQKIIVGITGTPKSGKRTLTAHLANDLSMQHFNVQQPAIDAVAAIAGLDSYEVYRAPCERVLEPYALSVDDLLMRIRSVLISENRNALLDDLQLRIHSAKRLSALFSGMVISGITRESEADWLRQQGGIIIHLRNTTKIAANKLIRVANDDLLYTFDTREKFINSIVPAALNTLREKMQIKQVS